jgi:2-octaprenyl-6-methoxyphenol hydroxylase
MTRKTKCTVAVIGGGLAGLTLSCLLAARGISVACIDQAVQAFNNDLRTTAISYGSRKILEEARIWQHLTGKTCAIEKIDILDGDSPVLLNFLSGEMEGKSFGWIVLNSDLRAAMVKELSTHKTAQHIQGQAVKNFEVREESMSVSCADQTLEAKLVIGADGRKSFVREWMDVPVREWSYRQRAIVCTAQHENSHNNIAVEHFWPEGPFAILPMADDEAGNHRSAVVFTEHGPEKKSLMHLSDVEFESALAEKFPENYGTVKLIGKRASHPLSLIHAARYIAPRMALVADAAHGIHPVAGQGLNLGFRDVKALADLLAEAHENGEDFGSDDVLEAYQRARRFDNMTMVAVTDGLVRLFSSRLPGAKFLRRKGLKAVAKLPAAKRFFMRQAMGDQ